MRIVWTLFKIIIVLAVTIPLAVFALALTVGLLSTALRLASIALVGYCVYRVARLFFAPSRKKPASPIVRDLPAPDPYYAAAMRELDAELRQ